MRKDKPAAGLWRRSSAMCVGEMCVGEVCVGWLLARRREGELAVADAHRQALGELRGRVLAVGCHELGEGGEQAGLRQAIAIDAVDARLRPGLVQIAERDALLFVFRN